MEEPPGLVHHKGRRFRRTSARKSASSAVKDGMLSPSCPLLWNICLKHNPFYMHAASDTSLPPPTPPSGKSRESMQAPASKTSFPYQVWE